MPIIRVIDREKNLIKINNKVVDITDFNNKLLSEYRQPTGATYNATSNRFEGDSSFILEKPPKRVELPELFRLVRIFEEYLEKNIWEEE